jgi:mannose/fructose/sorbose-specific phosphotransferase system IIA component
VIGVIVVGHGAFASGLLSASELIMGPQPALAALGLEPGTDLDGFTENLRGLLDQINTASGVLILADLLGGTPWNASLRLALEGLPVKVVSGANLPMLLEVLALRMHETPDSLGQIASQAGKEGVTTPDLSGMI